jgi:hypothetical protein
VLVGVPALTLAVIGSMRGSLRAHLVWIGMLAYSIYDIAYYVFGARFNDLFLLHVVRLWRRTAWGYAFGTAACLAVGVYQLNYIIQKAFVAEVGVAGVMPFDLRDLPVPAVLLTSATVLLLVSARRKPGRPRTRPVPQNVRHLNLPPRRSHRSHGIGTVARPARRCHGHRTRGGAHGVQPRRTASLCAGTEISV